LTVTALAFVYIVMTCHQWL